VEKFLEKVKEDFSVGKIKEFLVRQDEVVRVGREKAIEGFEERLEEYWMDRGTECRWESKVWWDASGAKDGGGGIEVHEDIEGAVVEIIGKLKKSSGKEEAGAVKELGAGIEGIDDLSILLLCKWLVDLGLVHVVC